jgi:hypothetical protein
MSKIKNKESFPMKRLDITEESTIMDYGTIPPYLRLLPQIMENFIVEDGVHVVVLYTF